MSKLRWVWAVVAVIAILAALGTGLWFGGGPTTRAGWESASWAAGITTALALIVTTIAWALLPKPAPPVPSPGSKSSGDEGTPVNTVNWNISSGTVAQGQDVRVENSSYGGNHNDFRGGTFQGPFINEQHNHRPSSNENPDTDR